MKQNSGKPTYLDEPINQVFDFDEWKNLNEKNPELFDAKRNTWIEEVIDSAPQSYQSGLRKIMSKVDQIKNQSQDDPMQSCEQISEMMVKSLADLKYFLEDLTFSLQKRP